MTTEPLAPLTDARVRELSNLARCGPDVVSLAQEVAQLRALGHSVAISNPRRILRLVTEAILKAFARHYPMAEYRDPVGAVERMASDFFVRSTQLNMLRLAAQECPNYATPPHERPATFRELALALGLPAESAPDAVLAAVKEAAKDTARLDWFDALSCAVTIVRDQPKADSKQTLRLWIDTETATTPATNEGAKR